MPLQMIWIMLWFLNPFYTKGLLNFCMTALSFRLAFLKDKVHLDCEVVLPKKLLLVLDQLFLQDNIVRDSLLQAFDILYLLKYAKLLEEVEEDRLRWRSKQDFFSKVPCTLSVKVGLLEKWARLEWERLYYFPEELKNSFPEAQAVLKEEWSRWNSPPWGIPPWEREKLFGLVSKVVSPQGEPLWFPEWFSEENSVSEQQVLLREERKKT